jgi:hypothetical protein
MMGYWDGALWTPHRQPLPPTPHAAPVSVQLPVQLPVQPPAPGLAGAGAPASPWSPQNLLGTAKQYLGDPKVQANGKAVAGGALIADGVIGFGERRQGLSGAIGTIIFAIVWLILTLGPGMPLNNAEPRAGTVHASATVVSVRTDSKGSCTPVAELRVNGTPYSIRSSMSEKPCPYMKGDLIDVTYHPDDIRATAAIAPSNGFKIFLAFAPWIGVLALIGGIWTFIKRAGSIVAGVVLLTKGLRGRRALKQTDRE